MLALKLAYRNLAGAGLRTWLNAFVLSLSFVVIVWHKGLLDGWNRQARRDMIAWELGAAQYWRPAYDPYDPFALADSHGPIPGPAREHIARGACAPILVTQGTVYPEGRAQSVLLRGIDPAQHVLEIPAALLAGHVETIPVLLGTRMASSLGLEVGDTVTLRWRDARGAFDAAEVQLAGVFRTNVPTVDAGQMWLPLERLQAMLEIPGQATLLVAGNGAADLVLPGWKRKEQAELLTQLDEIIRSKSVGGAILYALLLSLAMLAIFDTQVLSVFRRQREIGTDIALGMTRAQVIRLFTVEGAMHSVLAAALALLYGGPLLWLQVRHGFELPAGMDDYGLAVAEKIIPAYSVGLILGTTLLVTLSATIVSYIPARRIAKMNPTDAIRGKIQ